MGGIFVGAFILGVVFAKQEIEIPTPQDIAVKGVMMEVVALHDDVNKAYRIDVEYPQFAGAMDGINRQIASYVNEGMDDFKAIIEENAKARKATMLIGQEVPEYEVSPFTFVVTWEPKQINERYLSIILRVDAYEGGANARRELRTFNYDVVREKEIVLDDLFPGDVGYLGKVSRYAHDRLVETLGEINGNEVDENMVTQGTAPTRDNFRNFVFDESVIDLYFPKYQVAPGVAGEQHVVIPRKGGG